MTSPMGLAYRADGTLYVADFTSDERWEFDATTPGNSTLVGTFPYRVPRRLTFVGGLTSHTRHPLRRANLVANTGEPWHVDTVTPGDAMLVQCLPRKSWIPAKYSLLQRHPIRGGPCC